MVAKRKEKEHLKKQMTIGRLFRKLVINLLLFFSMEVIHLLF